MTSIYELTQEQQEIIDALFWLDSNDEQDEEEILRLERNLSRIHYNAENTVEWLGGIYLELKAIAAQRKEAKQRAERRQRVAENAEQRLKDKLLEIMQTFGLQKVSGDLCDIRTQWNPGKLEYAPDFDAHLLPDDCKKIVPEQVVPVAAEIMRHIKAGDMIDGVELVKTLGLRIG